MTKKAFFRERDAREIQDLRVAKAYSNRDLVERIEGLDPLSDALEIRTPIIPLRFYRGVQNWAEASRKCLKHGDYIALKHPETMRECNVCPDTPHVMRKEAFAKELENVKQEEIHAVGFSFQPQWGDKKKRVIPFDTCPKGIQLFAYAENLTNGIKVESYEDAKRVRREGASIVVEVPSRTRKAPRYRFRLDHVPVIRDNQNLASVLQLAPSVMVNEEGEERKARTPHEVYLIKYNWETERESSGVISFYPHDIAAYLAIIKQELKKPNYTPLEMNPFALFSKHGIEFSKKLGNNVLIFDPSLTSKDKLRKLHLAEKSILLARDIGHFGNDDIAYWDGQRDGRIRDYDWSVGGKRK